MQIIDAHCLTLGIDRNRTMESDDFDSLASIEAAFAKL